MKKNPLQSHSGLSGIATKSVQSLLGKAARIGIDPVEILNRAQVPITIEKLSSGQVKTIARHHVMAIYRECIVSIGRHSSSLDRKPQMHPDEFRLMCHCVINCRTLADVIERQRMFFRVRDDRISVIDLTIEATTAAISVDTLRKRKRFDSFLSDLAGMSIFCRFYAWLLGIGSHDFHVTLAYGSSYADEAIEDFFVGELTFGGAVNRISFPRALLNLPVIRTAEELDALLIDFPFDFITANSNDVSLTDKIRSIYGMSITRGANIPTLDELQGLTGQSISTIRRHLAQDGLSIRNLKDGARRDTAIHLLQNRQHSIDEIAQKTGFRDLNSFRIAFRRWTGSAPRDYRSNHAYSGQP